MSGIHAKHQTQKNKPNLCRPLGSSCRGRAARPSSQWPSAAAAGAATSAGPSRSSTSTQGWKMLAEARLRLALTWPPPSRTAACVPGKQQQNRVRVAGARTRAQPPCTCSQRADTTLVATPTTLQLTSTTRSRSSLARRGGIPAGPSVGGSSASAPSSSRSSRRRLRQVAKGCGGS